MNGSTQRGLASLRWVLPTFLLFIRCAAALEPITQVVIAHTAGVNALKYMEHRGVGFSSQGGKTKVRYCERHGIVRCPSNDMLGRVGPILRSNRMRLNSYLRLPPGVIFMTILASFMVEQEAGAVWAICLDDIVKDLVESIL